MIGTGIFSAILDSISITMAIWEYRDAPARIMALFALVGIILLGGVIWISWRLFEQDRALENERVRERLESASVLICREMDRTLANWERILDGYLKGAAVSAPPGAVVAAFDRAGISRHLGPPLLFQSVASPDPPSDIFAAAEAMEFRQKDYKKASVLYRDLAQSPDRLVRAGALMRLARCLRGEHRASEALPVYAKLAELGDTPVAGAPAALLAHHERIVLYQALGDDQNRERETESLAAALQSGSFRIDRETYEFYRESLPGQAVSPNEGMNLALAEAVASIRSRWLEAQGSYPARIAMPVPGHCFLAVVRNTPEGAGALIAGSDELISSMDASLHELRVLIQVIDAQGQAIWGERPGKDVPQVLKTSFQTGLPWSVLVASSDGAADRSVGASRRKLLLAAVMLITFALAAAGYAIFRSVTKEVRVAQLQSDFVAAVSHEFRTPLAAMCHLTESLEDDRVDDVRRPAFYHAMAKESRRLKEMVENLLDFARMESGREVYRKEELEMVDLVRGTVLAFQEQHAGDSRPIDLELPAAGMHVLGDGEALARAVRNLLDNAVKYSPASSPIRLSLSADGAKIAIAVADQGAGIAKAEQREIFRKFVRGSSSRSLNVKGTGIGLAMVRHIVDGHGGKITVTSEPGRGSRFTIELPLKARRIEPRRPPRPQSS